MDDAHADSAAGRETLRRIADAIDAGQMDSTSTMRAGIAGALGALGDPESATDDGQPDDLDHERQQARRSR